VGGGGGRLDLAVRLVAPLQLHPMSKALKPLRDQTREAAPQLKPLEGAGGRQASGHLIRRSDQ
jgi:hypothetical protein